MIIILKIAYCSPFSPIKSGISDFSEELVPELAELADIDLFYDKPIENKEISDRFNFYDISRLRDDDDFARQYDVILYQMGNNYEAHKCIAETFMKRPGIIELHDIALHHYLANETIAQGNNEKYKEILRYCHGEFGANTAEKFFAGEIPAPWDDRPMELTVNKHYIDKATGVVVHSDFAKQIVKALRPDVPVINIPLHVDIIDEVSQYTKMQAKKSLGIDEHCFTLGSFGFVSRAKRIYQVMEALAKYKRSDFRYIIVGKVIDPTVNIMEKAEELGIADKIIEPGYVTLEQYRQHMQACDICVNLRYPTSGESSANLQRILGMGIPAIVTDIGTFSEYPDSCTAKACYGEGEADSILRAIKKLSSSHIKYLNYKRNAVEYVRKTADIKNNCKLYASFFNDVINGSFSEADKIDRLLDIACQNGFYEEDYIMDLCRKAE